MRINDIIVKKRDGFKLSEEEINFFVEGVTNGKIADYQISALLMAIFLQKMDIYETTFLAKAMANSGDIVNLSKVKGIKVDKHSTGGVGDKTTLIVAPIVAACGGCVAKMSGRGLGHTGGTVDKLESIPSFNVSLPLERFISIVNDVGACVVSQTGNLAPADKILYAIRDVTGTVENISLIASSVMSKKLAAGADCIVLDIKTGSGAFMKTLDESIELAKIMVGIGENAGKKMCALVTNMDIPLGFAIGNSLEIIESVKTLKGEGPEDLTNICVELATAMLYISEKGSIDDCKSKVLECIKTGKAFEKFVQMVEAQGGDSSVIKNTELFEKPKISYQVFSKKAGYIEKMDAEKCGKASVVLGAGRETKESAIDYSAGILLNKKTGDFVKEGDLLATLFTSDEKLTLEVEKILHEAYCFSTEKPEQQKLIYAKVIKNEVEIL